MSATINEIAQNSTRAKEITKQAVDQSQKASDRVDERGKAADEINKVSNVLILILSANLKHGLTMLPNSLRPQD